MFLFVCLSSSQYLTFNTKVLNKAFSRTERGSPQGEKADPARSMINSQPLPWDSDALGPRGPKVHSCRLGDVLSSLHRGGVFKGT